MTGVITRWLRARRYAKARERLLEREHIAWARALAEEGWF
jgi:hypothetical protein